MAKKIQLQDANGNVLHPLTLGECVTMNSGENLDTLMSKSQMFTPTITQSKSMFKVGTGVDVDYSANVKDGAYESLVFKGKSLVNLLTSLRPDTHSAWVRNGSSFTLNASGVLFLNYTALLKPNTTYTVVGELDFDVDGIVIGFREGDKSWEVNRSIGSRGRFAVLISTSAESTSNALTAHRAVTSNSDRVTLSNLMVLEGDWTNAELPPYFEGLGSCKMPILRNVGKNLANQSKYEIEAYVGGNDGVTVAIGSASKNTQSIIMEIEPNVSIVASSSSNSDRKVLACFNHFPTNGSKATKKTNNGYITTDTDTKYVMYYYNSNTVANGIVSQVQIEESPSPTQYEPYKTNILRTSEEIVLREVNGVQDTYNALTGEYVQRIGERGYQEEDLTNPNVITDGVKTQYELTEPITTIVKPSTMTPFAYQNGHVILESGFEGQSLLPEIEYSVVTGRTGQVTQNTKVLRKQEQQIIGLEELLLTQVVQMEYERTLLQFDYELQMMMLG